MIEIALSQANSYFAEQLQIPIAVDLNASSSSNLAIRCNDTPSPTDFEFWAKISDQLAVVAPVFGGKPLHYNCTQTWGGASVTRPNLNNINKANPILMIQAQYDGATPLAGALTTFNTLENARLIYVTNSYNHGVFTAINNGCVDNAAAEYLLNGTLPETQIWICEGQGLLPNMQSMSTKSADTSHTLTQLPAALARKASQGRTIATSATYLNANEAEQTREQIQNAIVNAEKF